jgi:hypothetical protein
MEVAAEETKREKAAAPTRRTDMDIMRTFGLLESKQDEGIGVQEMIDRRCRASNPGWRRSYSTIPLYMAGVAHSRSRMQ